MAYISGKYTSATEYSITLGGMAIGTVYAILVQDLNSDGSSNGFVCKWKSGATSSTYTEEYTTSSTYSRYDRRIGFFQGSFNTDVGRRITDDQFNSWADGESVIKAWGGGGGGPTPTYQTNELNLRTGPGISSYKVKYLGSSGSTYNTATISNDAASTACWTRAGTNLEVIEVNYSDLYSSPFYFKEYTDKTFSEVKKTFADNDGQVYSSGTRYVKLFGTQTSYATYAINLRTGTGVTSYQVSYTNSQGNTVTATVSNDAASTVCYVKADSNLTITSVNYATNYAAPYTQQEYNSDFSSVIGTASGDTIKASGTRYFKIKGTYVEPTYKVTVAPNGGTYTGTSPITVSSGGSIDLTTVSNQTSRDGYVLTEWHWSANGKTYSTTAVITGISSNGTITAQWELKKHYYYQVKLYGNGGVFSDGSKTYTTYWWPKDDVASSETKDPKIDTSVFPSPTRNGYKLKGWAKTSDGTPTSQLTFTATSTDADNPTLDNAAYAIWAARQVLVYDYNGGRYGNETGTSSIYVDKGSTFEVNRVPSKDGYSFVGWKRTYDNKIYQEGQTFIIQAEKEVLTAQWEAPFKFRLSDTNEGLVSFQVNRYASQGGDLLESKTISSTNFIEIVARDSNYIEITNAITAVIKDGTKEINRNGFTVPLITARADSSSNQDQNEYLKVKTEGSVTQSPVYESYGFRAGLRPNHHTFLIGSFAKSYKYSLDANEGYWTNESTNPKKSSVKSTEQVDFSKYSSLVKRIGYKLEGWGLSATGGKVTVPNGKYWITDDTNFYAVWQAQPHIILDANGGKFDGTLSTKDFYIDYGDVLDFSQYKPSWYGEGSYILLGWAENPASTSPTYGVNEVIGPLYGAGPYKYYAVWQKSRATLTFYGNGGLWYGNLQKQSKTYEVGETVSFATYSNDLVRAGYLLLGWSTSPTATDAPWDPNGIVTVGATDADYYAVWQKHIDLFYWYGNDTQDAAKIAKGQPVTNLTATIWNEFKSRINQLTIAETGRSWSYSDVLPGDSITAAEVLAARNALAALNNNVPLPTANQLQTGKQILASYFNGTGSLKAALNIIINNYNKS